MPLYIWKTIKTKCSVRTGLDMFFVRYVFFPNTCINIEIYIYITGHAGRFAGVVWSPTMKSYRSLRRLWRWFEVLKTFVKKNEVSKNMPCLQSGTPDVVLFPVASVTFADFCWLPPGGLHRMWCVHHGGSPGFHHVIPGVCALSSLGSWETFGKPTGSLAPSGLENQMAPWWMLVISVQLRPYHTIPWRKTKNWFLWDDT